VDAIVIASHDGGSIGRSGYGGVAEALVARSPVPVVLARVWRSASEGNDLVRGSRLLVPLDGSRLAETALGPAAELARVLDGEAVLVRAVHGPVAEYFAAEMPASYGDGTLEAHKAEARAYLAEVADRLWRGGTRCSTVVCVGEPAGVIAEVGAQTGAAIVVMATHGLSGARRTLTGSVAARVLNRDRLPVMLIGPEVVAMAAMATA
jgi:nucleotide-binding universal stress UspA family protein